MRSINPKRFVGSFTVKNKCKEKEICVTELTTETFLDTVLDSKKVESSEYCIKYFIISVTFCINYLNLLFIGRCCYVSLTVLRFLQCSILCILNSSPLFF